MLQFMPQVDRAYIQTLLSPATSCSQVPQCLTESLDKTGEQQGNASKQTEVLQKRMKRKKETSQLRCQKKPRRQVRK